MWYKDLYVSQNLKTRKLKRIKIAIDNNKKIKDVYCLCLTDRKNVELEILSTDNLPHEKERSPGLIIIGLSESKEEAFELTARIVQEVFDKTQEVNLKKYFLTGVSHDQVV